MPIYCPKMCMARILAWMLQAWLISAAGCFIVITLTGTVRLIALMLR